MACFINIHHSIRSERQKRGKIYIRNFMFAVKNRKNFVAAFPTPEKTLKILRNFAIKILWKFLAIVLRRRANELRSWIDDFLITSHPSFLPLSPGNIIHGICKISPQNLCKFPWFSCFASANKPSKTTCLRSTFFFFHLEKHFLPAKPLMALRNSS